MYVVLVAMVFATLYTMLGLTCTVAISCALYQSYDAYSVVPCFNGFRVEMMQDGAIYGVSISSYQDMSFAVNIIKWYHPVLSYNYWKS